MQVGDKLPGEVVKSISLLTQLCTGVIIFCLMGCSYTILRDLDEEARQAELAAIQSLTVAPDLTISNIEYEYIPPPARRTPLDHMVAPTLVRFYLTVKNIGNADFNKPSVTREFRYDNNEAQIAIPGRDEFMHGAR